MILRLFLDLVEQDEEMEEHFTASVEDVSIILLEVLFEYGV